MTDPFSVTASALAVATAAVAIVKGLNDIAETIGSAGDEVRKYATEIRLVKNVLESIADQFNKKPKQSWSKAEYLLEDILDVCRDVMTPIDDVQKTMNILLERYKDSNKKMRQVAARVWWFFKYKDKMLSYRQSLTNLNITLNTHLAAMKLNTVDNVSINISIQQSSLELSVAEAERLLKERIELQLGTATSSRRAIEGGAASPRRSNLAVDENTREPGNPTPGPIITEVDDQVDPGLQDTIKERTPNMSQALIAYPGQHEDLDEDADGLDQDEIAEVERTMLGTLDRTSNGSVQEIWEDLGSVLRKVLRYAQEVNTAAAHTPMPAAPADPATTSSPPSAHFGDVHVVPNNDLPAKSKENSPGPLRKLPINDKFMIFKHVDGKSYQFPYDAVHEWHDARAAWLSLKFPRPLRVPFYVFNEMKREDDGEIMLRRDRDDVLPKDIFASNMFVLKNPDGHYIVPRFWEHTVQPGWTVELELDDTIGWEGRLRRARPVEEGTSRRDADRGSKKLTRFFKRDHWY